MRTNQSIKFAILLFGLFISMNVLAQEKTFKLISYNAYWRG